MAAIHHRVPATQCTACGAKHDSASALSSDTHPPKPGDVTVCIKCAHVMVFSDDLSLRDPNTEEAHDIAGDPDILKAVAAVGAVLISKASQSE